MRNNNIDASELATRSATGNGDNEASELPNVAASAGASREIQAVFDNIVEGL